MLGIYITMARSTISSTDNLFHIVLPILCMAGVKVLPTRCLPDGTCINCLIM